MSEQRQAMPTGTLATNMQKELASFQKLMPTQKNDTVQCFTKILLMICANGCTDCVVNYH